MPFKSEKQRKAMYAAASGRGNIGIDQAAAKKFIKHSRDITSLAKDKRPPFEDFFKDTLESPKRKKGKKKSDGKTKEH